VAALTVTPLTIGPAHATLRWPSRPRHEKTLVADRWIWQSRCGRFRVVHSRPFTRIIAERWLVLHFNDQAASPGWDIISRHQKKRRAFAAAEASAHMYP
jgi:hypothetical protein